MSNENLGSLRWTSWGGESAQGCGIDYANSPSRGRPGHQKVSVALLDRMSCDGKFVYTTVRITYLERAPYDNYPNPYTFEYGCPQF